MYFDNYATGNYKIIRDTLILYNHKFNNDKLSELEQLVVKTIFQKYLVLDSLLIPTHNFNYIKEFKNYLRDTSLLYVYSQSDGHANYKIQFNSDSTFNYKTATDMFGSFTKGIWTLKNDIIKLSPEKGKYDCINWITTNNELRLYKNYLIGRCKGSDSIKSFRYLNKRKIIDYNKK